MAQRRTDGERTRERILECALPLFADHGYAGTSIRMVARAADVNVATLAYHFTDKQGLYDTVVQRLHEDLIQEFPDSLPAGQNPSELVEGWIRQAWGFARAHSRQQGLLLRHLLDHRGQHPEVIAEQWSDKLMERAEMLIAVFRPDWDPPRRRILIASLQHLLVRYAIEDRAQLSRQLGEPDDLDEAIIGFLADMLKSQLGL